MPHLLKSWLYKELNERMYAKSLACIKWACHLDIVFSEDTVKLDIVADI